MPNESKTPEEYLSDALDLMVKAKRVKQHGPSAKGFGVDWSDRGKLAMEALGYVIEDLGPENFNQQLWWAERLRTWNLLRKADQALQRPYGLLCTSTKFARAKIIAASI